MNNGLLRAVNVIEKFVNYRRQLNFSMTLKVSFTSLRSSNKVILGPPITIIVYTMHTCSASMDEQDNRKNESLKLCNTSHSRKIIPISY